MTATETRDWLLRQLYAERPATIPATWHYDVAVAINAALQEMFRAPAGESYSRQNWSFSTVPGSQSYALSESITRLLGHATADHYEMREVEGDGNARQLASRFGVSLSPGSRPRYYWLSRTFRSQSDPEAHLIHMHLLPVPVSIHTVRFTARVEPRRFTACDLDSGSTEIPIPDREVENLFLPIALWHLGQSVKMTSVPIRAGLDARYARARAELGYVEPSHGKRQEVAP